MTTWLFLRSWDLDHCCCYCFQGFIDNEQSSKRPLACSHVLREDPARVPSDKRNGGSIGSARGSRLDNIFQNEPHRSTERSPIYPNMCPRGSTLGLCVVHTADHYARINEGPKRCRRPLQANQSVAAGLFHATIGAYFHLPLLFVSVCPNMETPRLCTWMTTTFGAGGGKKGREDDTAAFGDRFSPFHGRVQPKETSTVAMNSNLREK